jgi:hypothetical protein
MGCLDSKALTAETRSTLLSVLSSDPDNLGWSVRVVRYAHCDNSKLSTLIVLLQSASYFEWYVAPTTYQSKSAVRRGHHPPHPRSASTRDHIDGGTFRQANLSFSLISTPHRCTLTHLELPQPMKNISPPSSQVSTLQ